MEQWLADRNEWLIFGVLLLLLAAAAEFGFRLARRAHGTHGSAPPEVSGIQGAVLGLLALLLGFTFAMAAERFQNRKELLRDEANAIGTVYLRTRLLPEPYRTSVAQLLRRYVDTRFDLQSQGYELDRLSDISARAAKLQAEMWSEAVTVAERNPQSVMIGLFVASLNDMIDMDGKQLAALRSRIPAPIFIMLFFVAIIAVGLTGYGSGQRHRQSATLTLLVGLLVASVIVLIVDLHRPTRGFITLDMGSMTDVRNSMSLP